MVSPLGNDVESSWDKLRNAQSSIVDVAHLFDLFDLASLLDVKVSADLGYDIADRLVLSWLRDDLIKFLSILSSDVTAAVEGCNLSDYTVKWLVANADKIKDITSYVDLETYLKAIITGSKNLLNGLDDSYFLHVKCSNEQISLGSDTHCAHGIVNVALEWLVSEWKRSPNYNDIHACSPVKLHDIFDRMSAHIKKWSTKADRFILYAMLAAQEAIRHSKLLGYGNLDRTRVGVVVGSGIGGIRFVEDTTLRVAGKKRVTPFFSPGSLINLAAGHIAIEHQFLGPIDANVTACASGGHAIINAVRNILDGSADVMVAGGAESAITGSGIAGFAAMRALSKNRDPGKASRPWDKARDGFVMADGSGIIVIESLEHAQARGATILAEIVGYGSSSDGYHVSAPAPEAVGAIKAMKGAIGEISTDEISYINAHGTSTPIGDVAEIRAIRKVFENPEKLAISSNKSAMGHMLGASASTELIFTIKTILDSCIPPTLNLDSPDDECQGLNLVPHKAQYMDVNYALSNSFGFGGANASILLKKWVDG